MQVFSEIIYKRPDYRQVTEILHQCTAAIKAAKTYETLKNAYLQWCSSKNSADTMRTVAFIRNTCDIDDEYYDAEMRYINSELPKLAVEMNACYTAILESPYKNEFQEEFGQVTVQRMEAAIRLADASVVEDRIRESELRQQYVKALGKCVIEFRGRECNMYNLLKHMESTDRMERRDAFRAWSTLYEQVSEELDAIYDELVHLRIGITRKLGFDDPIEMFYMQRDRYDYTKADSKKFRQQILKEVVPACAKLRERQRIRLGVDKLYYYDETLMRPEGNANPVGDKEYLVHRAQEMYHELCPETGEFFDFMAEYRLFDLDSRTKKRQGGYCTFMPEFKAPFIFSNFNGTSADVDVLTHEAGHAFAAYTASRSQDRPDGAVAFSEIAEIHSMTMEHWTYPWMDKFFGDKAEEYCQDHLASSLLVIPYMACVDEYQEKVYDNPGMTPMERRAQWKEIERTYMPWRDYDGNEFMEGGAFWMQKGHIFQFPFYYLDYALAQICAFQLYQKKKEDYESAWSAYLALCKAGANKGYFEQLQMAGLEKPFADGAVKRAVSGVLEELGV